MASRSLALAYRPEGLLVHPCLTFALARAVADEPEGRKDESEGPVTDDDDASPDEDDRQDPHDGNAFTADGFPCHSRLVVRPSDPANDIDAETTLRATCDSTFWARRGETS